MTHFSRQDGPHQIRRRHQAIGVAVMLVDTDPVVTEVNRKLQLIEVLMIQAMPLSRIVERFRYVHPDARITCFEIGWKVPIRHEMEGDESHGLLPVNAESDQVVDSLPPQMVKGFSTDHSTRSNCRAGLRISPFRTDGPFVRGLHLANEAKLNRNADSHWPTSSVRCCTFAPTAKLPGHPGRSRRHSHGSSRSAPLTEPPSGYGVDDVCTRNPCDT